MINSASLSGIVGNLSGLAALLRPKQWVKNGFVLAPLMFTGHFLDPDSLGRSLFAAALFCLASSATYIVNDMRDANSDRRHPKKSKTRPLASGKITMAWAGSALAAIYFMLVLGGIFMPKVGLVLLAYIAMNFAYTFALKHQPVIDIFTVAIGFMLRVYAGAVALSVPMSEWMFVTTLCLALYLAAVKRRQELAQNIDGSRKVLEKYSAALINRYAEMAATGALVFYSMFVMSAKPQLVMTVPLVLFGLFRYWFVVEKLDGGESPTDVLFEDKQLLITIALWVAACLWGLWPMPA